MTTFLQIAVLLVTMAFAPSMASPYLGHGASLTDAAQAQAQARAMGMMGASSGMYGMAPGAAAGYGVSALGPAGLTADQFGRASYGSAALAPSAAVQLGHAQRLGLSGAEAMGAPTAAAAYGAFGAGQRSANAMNHGHQHN